MSTDIAIEALGEDGKSPQDSSTGEVANEKENNKEGEGKENESGKEKEGSEKDAKTGSEDDKEGDKTGKASGKSTEEEIDEKDAQIRELRQVTRDQKRSLAKVEEDHANLTKLLTEKDILETPEEDDTAKAKETVMQEMREEHLKNISDLMAVNPNYPNFSQVCSQENFDDMIEALARKHQSDNGGDLDAIVSEVEDSIWKMRNPYKFMYEQIKKYHPRYVVKETDKTEGKDKVMEEKKAKSINDDLGGGDSTSGGKWTAAKIDNLPEDEIGKVPADIYDKYLKDELD